MSSNKNSQSRPNKFLSRLYSILSDSTHSTCINWSESGESLIISDISEFTSSVLPLYFRHKNFSSFIRQLNMYGFHKERDSGSLQTFSHPFFTRNNQENLNLIHRKSSEHYSEIKTDLAMEKKYCKTILKKKKLNEKLKLLEFKYQEAVGLSQYLMCQILQTCDREQKAEQFLGFFAKQVAEVPEYLNPLCETVPAVVRPIPVKPSQLINYFPPSLP